MPPDQKLADNANLQYQIKGKQNTIDERGFSFDKASRGLSPDLEARSSKKSGRSSVTASAAT